MKDKLTLSISASRIAKVKRHAKRTKQTVSEFVERSIDKATAVPQRITWVDELYGSARFTESDLKGDERLGDLVRKARTKPTTKQRKRA
jgi:hypothetical protein